LCLSDGPIDDDAIEPGLERPARIVPTRRARDRKEGLGDDVVGCRRITEDPVRDPLSALGVSNDQVVESGYVAAT
jgi:hypothetical protein